MKTHIGKNKQFLYAIPFSLQISFSCLGHSVAALDEEGGGGAASVECRVKWLPPPVKNHLQQSNKFASEEFMHPWLESLTCQCDHCQLNIFQQQEIIQAMAHLQSNI